MVKLSDKLMNYRLTEGQKDIQKDEYINRNRKNK